MMLRRISLYLAAVLLAAPAAQAQSPPAGSPSGVMQTNWGGGYPAPVQYGGPPQQYACPPGGGYDVPPELVGEQPWGYDDDSRLDLVLKETVRRSWVRFEYLNMNIQGPGHDLLGAQLATQDARQPYTAFDAGNIPRLGVFAVTPDVNGVQLQNNNGFRFTVGVPTELGTLEADAWTLAQATNEQRIRPVVDLGTGITLLPAISLQSAGNPSDNTMVLFDTDYRAALRTDLWGTQANFYFNPASAASAISFRPLLGIRYMQFFEELSINGTDVLTGTSPHVLARSNNNMAGGQFGFRLSHDNDWFSLGIEPKLMVGVNRVVDNVKSSDILTAGNSSAFRSRDTNFCPALDLSSYAKIHLSKSFSLFGGYQLLVLPNVSRPTDNIRYNSPLDVANDPPEITLRNNSQVLLVHGFMVGGELRFQ
jgi:hypothetical protein